MSDEQKPDQPEVKPEGAPAAAPKVEAATVPAAAPKPAAPPAPKKWEPTGEVVATPATEKLAAHFGEAVQGVKSPCGEAVVLVKKEKLAEVLAFLKSDADCAFDYLSNLTAAHYPNNDKKFEVVYDLYSIGKRHTLRVKVALDDGEACPTAVPVWPTADWQEREAHDMYGVAFEGHPNLKVIFKDAQNDTLKQRAHVEELVSAGESPVPQDLKLAEFAAWNIPPQLKLHGRMRPTTKYIFRKAMQDILPAEVLNQPKAGFAAPIDYWLANDLRPMVDDLLSESNVRRRGLFQPAAVRQYVEEHRSGAEDWSMQIWQFLTLELWMQAFLDGNSREAAAVHTQVANA